MVQELYDEKQMERYLLGQLPDAEAARLEERGLADYDFFEHLLVVENRLIEAYLTGELPQPERAQFEASFMTSPKRRARVEMTRVLLDRLAKPAVVPAAAESERWWDRLKAFFQFNNFTAGLMTATALVLFAVAAWSWRETGRVREELAQLGRERAALQQREQELLIKLNSQQTQTEQQRKEIESIRAENERLKAIESKLQHPQSSFSTIASVVLVLAGPRGALSDKTPRLTIPATATTAQLTMVFDQELLSKIIEVFPNVRAELSRTGQIKFRQSNLKPRRAKTGQAFVIKLPVSRLSDGNYQVSLFASGLAGEQPIGNYEFTVEKKSR